MWTICCASEGGKEVSEKRTTHAKNPKDAYARGDVSNAELENGRDRRQ